MKGRIILMRRLFIYTLKVFAEENGFDGLSETQKVQFAHRKMVDFLEGASSDLHLEREEIDWAISQIYEHQNLRNLSSLKRCLNRIRGRWSNLPVGQQG